MVRVSKTKYESLTKENQNNLHMHLTNAVLQAKDNNTDINGNTMNHKMSMDEFISYANESKMFDVPDMKQFIDDQITDVITRTLVALEKAIQNAAGHDYFKKFTGLYGIDVIFDD